MQHKCKVTVIDKKLFPDLQEKYLADPKSGACPFYEIGQEFVFERYGGRDDFWREGNGTQCAKPGTASAAISIRHCKGAQSCADGQTTNAS